jgi:acyl-CoA reductase-like NAD-dependent aldehyde dehydrogenase
MTTYAESLSSAEAWIPQADEADISRVLNPATEAHIASYRNASEEDVDAAMERAWGAAELGVEPRRSNGPSSC